MYHFLWIGPLHVAVMTYLLYLEVQWTAFIVAILIVLQIPLQMTLVYFYSKLRSVSLSLIIELLILKNKFAVLFLYRFKAARLTDRRVKIMNEVITGIRVIKMYAWEYAFSHVVSTIRK